MVGNLKKLVTSAATLAALVTLFITSISLSYGQVNLQEKKSTVFIGAGSFNETGDWKISYGIDGAINNLAILGQRPEEVKKGSVKKPAKALFNIEKSGRYTVWIRSADYGNNQPGKRFFNIQLNGRPIGVKFGTHGSTGFKWTSAGTFELTKGVNLLELMDSSGFFAKCDGIYLTNNPNDVPVEYAAESGDYKSAVPALPAYAKSVEKAKNIHTLKNAKITINFLTVETKERTVIQQEVFVKGVEMIKRIDDFALLLLSAKDSKIISKVEGFPVFSQVLSDKGTDRTVITPDLYQSGTPEWLMPISAVKTSENTVKLTYGSERAMVTAVWRLDEQADEPVVSITITAKKKGFYSVVVPGHKDFEDADYEYALVPMRIANKSVYKEAYIHTEQYLFTPMVSVSLPETNAVASKSKVTYGYTVEPSSVPLRWVYNDNNLFGVCLRSIAGKISANLVAPMFGTQESNFEVGKSHTFQYRPLYRAGDWFETYKHVTQDIYKLRDYRKNHYTSLTDAILNTTDLMLDDEYGGWDSIGKAHWNMEGRNFSSNANPIQAVQSYLLSENEDMLKKRAVPTLANLLTRSRLHFKWDTITDGANYLRGVSLPASIGSPISGYNTSVFGGLYESSKGSMPVLKDIAIQKGSAEVVNSYGSIPSFVNDLAMYKLFKKPAYLQIAKDGADKYISERVFAKLDTPVRFGAFSYISYVPNLASLLDIYETTREQKYLKAAEYTGRILLTQLWVSGIDGSRANETLEIKADDLRARPFMWGHNFFWHGAEKWRPGSRRGVEGPPENLGEMKDEIVPAWVPSRVGLGLEQPSTFYRESLNMIMSSWAGDMMKLSVYTNEKMFETAARNAIVGRFGNYPGYYQNRFVTLQQRAAYPYKGPDFSSVYWHHIPPFLAMLEDFVIAQAWKWSDKQIEFPSIRQQGYAYFNSNQYGHKPGRFFNQSDMWLWLDRDIITPGSVQIDWIAARKDGIAGIALMNEDDQAVSTQLSFGKKLGAHFSGTAKLHFPDGRIETITITKGICTVTIPARSLVGLVIANPEIKQPKHAAMQYQMDAGMTPDNTVADHGNGKGIILQLSPEKYFAYVYSTELPKDVKSITISYQTGKDKAVKKRTDQYPFEFIVEVNDSAKGFKYSLEIERSNGAVVSKGPFMLKPIPNKYKK